jgi:hypothetical protein
MTTQPVRNIMSQRPRIATNFLDHLSHITWRIRVAHQLSGHIIDDVCSAPAAYTEASAEA